MEHTNELEGEICITSNSEKSTAAIYNTQDQFLIWGIYWLCKLPHTHTYTHTNRMPMEGPQWKVPNYCLWQLLNFKHFRISTTKGWTEIWSLRSNAIGWPGILTLKVARNEIPPYSHSSVIVFILRAMKLNSNQLFKQNYHRKNLRMDSSH